MRAGWNWKNALFGWKRIGMIKFRWPITRWSTVRSIFEEQERKHIRESNKNLYGQKRLEETVRNQTQQILNLKGQLVAERRLNTKYQQQEEDAYFERLNEPK